MKPRQTIAVIAYNRINPFLLSIPGMVFSNEPGTPGAPRFKVMVCAAEQGPLTSTAGFKILPTHTMAELRRADMVIVPSWRDAAEAPPEALLSALRAAHRRGRLVVGLCLGTYVLAAAGLLNERSATTHWGWSDDLARRYPRIDVKPGVLYVDEGDVVTSAGVAAGIDCCLHLLRKQHGAEAACHVARRLVVSPHRPGGQAQFIETPVPGPGTEDRLGESLQWMQRTLAQDHSIDSLARRIHMSRRTFTRHFRNATGTTLSAWLLTQRLALAQRLLETTTQAMELVAEKTGFGSVESLRFHFRRELKTTPSRYRKEFRGEE